MELITKESAIDELIQAFQESDMPGGLYPVEFREAIEKIKPYCIFTDAFPQWIPVSERLPDIGVEVLVYVRDNLHSREWQGVASIGHDIRYRRQKAWNFADMPRKYSYEQITERMQYEVLAWMKLPEPPKMEKRQMQKEEKGCQEED